MAGLGVGETLLGEALLADAGMTAAFEGLAPELLLGGAGDIAGMGIASLTPELMGGALAPEAAGIAADAVAGAAPEALSNIPSYVSPSGIQSAGIDSLLEGADFSNLSPEIVGEARPDFKTLQEVKDYYSSRPAELLKVPQNEFKQFLDLRPEGMSPADAQEQLVVRYGSTGSSDPGPVFTSVDSLASPTAAPVATSPTTSAAAASKPGLLDKASNWWKGLGTTEKMLYGGLGSYGLKMLRDDAKRYGVPNQPPYTGPLSRFGYNPALYNPSSSYLPMYRAQGGIMSLDGPDMAVGGQPMLSAPVTRMASGGISDLGSYSDGGRLLKDDQGDGMNDGIPATIAGKRPARLSEGEFVVPADVVSDLGNGSTDAGAKQLYAMMARVRKARHGTESQGRQVNPRQLMSA
jgi:hypothetical protein